MLHDNFINKAEQESLEFKALMDILASLNAHAEEGRNGKDRPAY